MSSNIKLHLDHWYGPLGGRSTARDSCQLFWADNSELPHDEIEDSIYS